MTSEKGLFAGIHLLGKIGTNVVHNRLMSRSRRLTFVIPSMTGGGAERQMSYLANHAVANGYDCSLITLSNANTDVYPLDSRVHRIGINAMRQSSGWWDSIQSNRKRIGLLKQALCDSQPDGVVSFCDRMNVMTIQAISGVGDRRMPIVISERSDPRQQKLGWVWEAMRHYYYPKCTACVVQTSIVGDYLKRIVGRSKPMYVIPTAFGDPGEFNSPAFPQKAYFDTPAPCKRLLFVGRLSYEKGIDRLLAAWPSLHERFTDWRLVIAGEGPEKATWIESKPEAPVSNAIDWLGWVQDVRLLMRECDAFVLPSRYEGFPNALIEAMDSGLPCLTTNCSASIEEVIPDEKAGLVVPNDSPSLRSGLEKLLGEENLRDQFRLHAKESVAQFSWPIVSKLWDNVLQSLIEDR